VDDTTIEPRRRPVQPASRARLLAAGLGGLLAASAAVSVGHLVASALRPAASPLLAVGSTFIDLTPEWLKSFAIATFGESDKAALLGGIAATVALVAVAIGVLSLWHPRAGAVAIGLFGVVGAAAALSRPAADAVGAVPSLVGAAAGIAVLLGLHRALVGGPGDGSAPETQGSRRRFLLSAVGVGALVLVSGGAGVLVAARRAAAATAEALGGVPLPLHPAPALPPGVDLGIAGVAPFTTPNADFYRVDTALDVPIVDAGSWRLRVHGMVEREIELTFAELIELPTIERDITLSCVSNVVGGRYVGNARWIGVPLTTVLELAGVRAGADQIVSTSADGFTAGTPTAVATDGRDAMLAFAMNGEPLPAVHGYPVRMLVPGLYGYVSATKWLVDLELTTFEAYDAYWVQRGWAPEAPIKTMSRIDAPRPLARLAAGRVAIAGVAWAQHRGIQRVEVRIDDGPWNKARLAATGSTDTWRQWVYAWDAPAGNHTLQVRATDGDGVIQTDVRSEPFPSGATGWHNVVVTVA
jgi:DMSO/TMAO reductase YedYZ molybdopterin-dependent catalytic subunit